MNTTERAEGCSKEGWFLSACSACVSVNLDTVIPQGEENRMSNRKIRWGIIGTARIAERLVQGIKASQNGTLLAIASRTEEKAKAFARQHSIPRAYGSYEALLKDPEIEAVYNPLPNSLHGEWTIRAAEAGKPTLCEKPMACNAAEAEQMIHATRAHHVLLMEAFMYRFHPQIIRLKEMLDRGDIGALRVIRAAFTFGLYDLNNVRLKKELCGGALMDVGCYCIHFSRYVAGSEPTEVFAVAHIGPESGVDEMVVGTLIFPEGVVAQFDCSFRSAGRAFCEVVGSEGKIDIPSPWVPGSKPGTLTVTKGRTSETIEVGVADSYQLEAEHFGACLIEGTPLFLPPEEGLKNMRVIDAVYRSARNGKPAAVQTT